MWIFHTVPRPGEFGYDTWLEDSASYTGNTGVWAQMSADEELGLAYLPTELPTHDYYGGFRPGNNLFSESIVAVDLRTGQRKWHYQLVHHGIWDMDIPAPPILADITVNGRTIKALAQPTKQAFLYVLDRETGEPIWPIEERPVPKGDTPREWYSPTQPFPTKPPAYDGQGLTIDDLIDFTPELRAEAVKLVSRYRLGPIFTPPARQPCRRSDRDADDGRAGGGDELAGWLVRSGNAHGVRRIANRGRDARLDAGAAGTLGPSVLSRDDSLGRAPDRRCRLRRGCAAAPSVSEQQSAGLTVQGLPLIKPPYSRITAIDLDTGEFRWQVPFGATPDNIRNHPALKGLNLPPLGRPGNNSGTLVTRTLLVAGESNFGPTPSGARGAMLRAFDKATGTRSWRGLPARAAKRLADDLHVERQAVHCRGDQRRRLSR